jgi:hypothetical protein
MKNYLLLVALLVSPFHLMEAKGGKGMTWNLMSHDSRLYVDRVGCNGCNAYIGDTPCNTTLPVLCYSKTNLPRPPYSISAVNGASMSSEFYNGWSGGIFLATTPVNGTLIKTSDYMNNLCASQFGKCFGFLFSHKDHLNFV